MKSKVGRWPIILAALFMILVATSTGYAFPNNISYQGLLTDDVGAPINGTKDVTFRLFYQISGGTEAWTETQAVTFSGGAYSVDLGSVTPLDLENFSFMGPALWLEIEVDGETLSPRQTFSSVPLSGRAKYADNVSEAALPSGGLNEVSGQLLKNQFDETFASTAAPVAIPDNSPTGIEDSIVFPNIGIARSISISVDIDNSDVSTLTITLTDPDSTVHTLYDGGTGGTDLVATYPWPNSPVSGDLHVWDNRNPFGTWTLKVVDSGFLDNTTDGNLVSWNLSANVISSLKVEVSADLDVTGTVSGDGSGLTNVEWGNLVNVPGALEGGSIDGLGGGEILGNLGIGTNPSASANLNILGSGSEPYGGSIEVNYGGTQSSYGLYARSVNPGSGHHYGAFLMGRDSTNNNYGLYSTGQGGLKSYGLYAYALDASNESFGVYSTAPSSASVTNYGVRGEARFGSSSNYGIYGYHYNSNASSSAANYGVYGYSYGLGTSSNYGIYGAAYGNNAYAGYFTGDTAVLGNTMLGTSTKYSTSQLRVHGGTADTYTGYFLNTDNVGSGFGLYSEVNGATNQTLGYIHYGLYTDVSGARTNYGSYNYVVDNGANQNFGIYATARGANQNYAVRGYIYDTGTDVASSNYGLYGYVNDSSSNINYGVYGYASNGTSNYAIYGAASSSTGWYAGYFYGSVAYTGTISDVSDRRLKDNIQPVTNALDKVQGINGVYFNMHDSPDVTEVGVIAQDVQAVLPEAVTVMDPENGYLGVSYPSLIPVLIEAVKELKAENDDLKARVSALESK